MLRGPTTAFTASEGNEAETKRPKTAEQHAATDVSLRGRRHAPTLSLNVFSAVGTGHAKAFLLAYFGSAHESPFFL